jgi:AcrR family transcriptional regulator
MPPTPIAAENPTTRDRVRAAALELFGEKGYDGVSMNELAERVGIAKPSLYNYYRSKEELLIDLVGEGLRHWTEHCMAPLARAASFERQLADHLRLAVDFAERRPHVVAVFHMATTHVQGELAERIGGMVAAMEAEVQAIFRARIERALAEREIDAPSTEDVMIFLGVFFHGLLFLQTNCRHQVGPLHARLEQVWHQLFRAVAGRPPREPLTP